jgi:response regulator RpfG family c-di-GMP phosphodiesterase
LHIDVTHLSEHHRRTIEDTAGSTKALSGRNVLVVDDDIRNIFALSSVLEDYGMDIRTADNGREAIESRARAASTWC